MSTFLPFQLPRKSGAGGFTLIELLVVIAIIAILAAILFPVFALAKISAKNTVSLSNIRQLGTAAQIYLSDNDDRFFQTSYFGSAGQTTPDNFGAFRWPWLLTPYTKDRHIFRSPLDTVDLTLPDCNGGCRAPENPYYGYLWGLFPSYGYNWFGLAPDTTWNTGLPYSVAVSSRSQGKVATQLASPSETIFLIDSTYGEPANPTHVGMGYYLVYPPAAWTGAPPLTRSSYGYVWPRYNNQATTLFADSHARPLSIGKLSDVTIWGVQ